MSNAQIKPRAILYLRVSSKEQLKGKSLDTQKADCLRYCADQGFEVVEIFTEKGESAKNEDRTELQNLLAYCREHRKQVQYLTIWKVDRLARSVPDYYEIRKTLMAYGVSIRSATETAINGDDLTAEAMEGLLALWARLDNKIKSDRAKANMEALLLTGISPWKLPIGYQNMKNKEHGKKKTAPDPIDPERFPIIQRGLKEYVTGVHTINSLTKRFREWGLTTRSGKRIYPQMVERMLTDITYAAWLPNPWGDEPVRGLHTPAITLDEYHKIQLIKAGKSVNHAKPRERANEEFPLRNFVRCSECRATLTGSGSRGHGGRYAYYHCKKRGCKLYGKTVPKEDLEADFIILLERVKPTEDAVILFKEIALDMWETKRQEHNTDAERLQKKVDELNNELREIISMKARSLITEEQFLEQKYPLDEAIIAAKVAFNEARIEEWDIETAISYAAQFMTDLPRQWRDYSLQQKHQFQQLVFPGGVVYEKNKGMLEPKLSAIYQLLQDVTKQDFDLVPPRGVEPLFQPSEGCALSIELWGRTDVRASYQKIPRAAIARRPQTKSRLRRDFVISL